MTTNPSYHTAKFELLLSDRSGKPLYGVVIPHRFDVIPAPNLTHEQFDDWVRKNSIPPEVKASAE